ncbi:DUF192 domain-containing protein [Candidatus Woesearchaeota archaeon]|nr:DUF192 domain-containing protein [Candidatus Woesearchaeota archaeon]
MITNKTKGFKIIDKQRTAGNLFTQGLGLMFRPKTDYCLVFPLKREVRLSLTMLFVFFPIDVLFLDSDKQVVDIKKGFKPFALNYTPRKPARYILEFPAGLLKETSEGDEIAIG